MKFFRKILAALLPRNYRPSNRIWLGGRGTHGIHVDHDIAMTFGAVFAAVKVISESLGVLGMHRFNRTREGGKERLDNHPATRVLNRQWNPYMSAQTGKEVASTHALLYGNGYAEIVRDAAGRLYQLWPLLPDRMLPQFIDGELIYRYLVRSGEYVDLRADQVLHIKGLGFDGVCGYDVVTYMSRTIGHGIAAEQYAGGFFGNGAHLSGALFHPGELGKEAKEKLRAEFNSVYRGSHNAFRMAVFEEGLEWKSFATTPEAAQMIQTRKFSVTDIARWFRVPPHMLADLEKATFSNIEQQALEFVVHTLLPWVVRWEQEADLKLVQPGEAAVGFHKMNISTLLRGDQKSRFESYKVGREWGWLSADDIREYEDMDPLGGPVGNMYILPLNFQRAEDLAAGPPPGQGDVAEGEEPPTLPPPEGEEPVPQQAAARAVLAHISTRMQDREDKGMRGHWGKPDFVDRAQRFFNRHLGVMAEELRPAMALYAVQQGAQQDDSRIDVLIREITAAWCDERFASWMDAAKRNAKPQASAPRYAVKLTDRLIETFTGAFHP